MGAKIHNLIELNLFESRVGNSETFSSYFFNLVAFGFSWKSVSVIGWVAIKPTADWNRIVYRTFCMCLLPPISCVGGVILNQRRWYRRFKRGAKTIEIQLCRKEDPDPVTFTHMVLHPGRALMRQGIRKNLLGRLRQTLGPFISAREAWAQWAAGADWAWVSNSWRCL